MKVQTFSTFSQRSISKIHSETVRENLAQRKVNYDMWIILAQLSRLVWYTQGQFDKWILVNLIYCHWDEGQPLLLWENTHLESCKMHSDCGYCDLGLKGTALQLRPATFFGRIAIWKFSTIDGWIFWCSASDGWLCCSPAKVQLATMEAIVIWSISIWNSVFPSYLKKKRIPSETCDALLERQKFSTFLCALAWTKNRGGQKDIHVHLQSTGKWHPHMQARQFERDKLLSPFFSWNFLTG